MLQYTVFKHTGDGFPASLKDERRYGQELSMDQVEQVILRSVCLDGFELGVAVGRRLAEKKAAKDNKAAKNTAPDCQQVPIKKQFVTAADRSPN